MTESCGVMEALRENWFWAGILRDHASMIHDSLAPDQQQLVAWAQGFKLTFDQLHGEAEQLAKAAGIEGPAGFYALAGKPKELPLTGVHGKELAHHAQQADRLSAALVESIHGLRSFKEQLLQLKLECQVKLNMGTVLLAHMVVEAEEALRVMTCTQERAPVPPALEALHHHLIWLPDASGHAVTLHNGLDGPEQKLREKTEAFHHIFDGMHLKAIELYSMLRVAPRMVGALRRLNRDAVAQIGAFRGFLGELRELLEGCQVLGMLAPMLADHMLREELYYTEKITALDDEAK